jgi:hypothetical protein
MTSAAGTFLATSQAQAEGVGFLVVVLLGIATWLLLRSLNGQLKKVPKSFDPPGEYDDDPAGKAPRGR